MKAETITRLVTLALDTGATQGEARAAWWRILDAAREGGAEAQAWISARGANNGPELVRLRSELARVGMERDTLRHRSEQDRQETERLVAEVQRLRRQLEASEANTDPVPPGEEDDNRARNGHGGSGRGAPTGGRVITVRWDAKCADPDCRAAIPAGARARWWGRGRVYCLTHESAEAQQ